MPTAGTVSEMIVKGKVVGKGEITGRLFRHLSPSTMAILLREVPLSGRINHFEKNFVYILTNVVAGEEKSRREFKKGEIAFMPAGSMFCIFLQDTKSYKPMNPLGHLDAGLETLQKAARGDSLEISEIHDATGAG